MVKLTDEQVYCYLIEQLHENYNLMFNWFRMAIGIRHKEPLDDTFWAVMCSIDGKTWIEFTEVSESVFLRLCPAIMYHDSKRERGWDFLYSKPYSRNEIEAMFTKQTRQGIISDMLLDLEQRS